MVKVPGDYVAGFFPYKGYPGCQPLTGFLLFATQRCDEPWTITRPLVSLHVALQVLPLSSLSINILHGGVECSTISKHGFEILLEDLNLNREIDEVALVLDRRSLRCHKGASVARSEVCRCEPI